MKSPQEMLAFVGQHKKWVLVGTLGSLGLMLFSFICYMLSGGATYVFSHNAHLNERLAAKFE